MSGLGAFIRGGMEGYQFGENIDARRAAQERQERLDAIAEEQRLRTNRRQDENDAFIREDRAYVQSERERTAADREWVEGVHSNAESMVDDAMAANARPDTPTAPAEGLGAVRPQGTPPASVPPVANNITPSPVTTTPMPPEQTESAQGIPNPGVDPAIDANFVRIAREALDTGEYNGVPLTEDQRARFEAEIVRRSPSGARPASASAPEPLGASRPATTPAPTPASATAAPAPAAPMGTRSGEQERVIERSSNTWAEEYRATAVPYIVEQFMRRGMVEEAQQYQDWADSRNVAAGMRDYARASMGAAIGDFDLFSEAVVGLYNNEEYYGDGLQIVPDQSDFIRDPEGNVVGAQITFQDAEGTEFTRQWESLDELVNEALAVFAPERAFELQIARGDAATEARLENATNAAESERDFMDWMRKEVFKSELEAGDADLEQIQDIVKQLSEDLNSGFNNAETTDEQRLAMVLAQVQLIEDARAAVSGRPASSSPGAGAAPTPAEPPQNVLRRP